MQVEEVWTEEFIFYRLGNMGTVKFRNDFGFIPYAWANGETSSHNDPALEGLSVIFPMLGLEPWVQMLMGVLASWSIIGGTPILKITTDASVQNAGGGAVSDIPLGKQVDLGPGKDMSFVVPPPVGREVLEFINLLIDFIDRAGITPLASGNIGTRTPGMTFAAALEAAAGKLLPLQANLESVFSEVVRMSWMTIDKVIKQPIHVTGSGLVEGGALRGKRKGRGRFIIDPKDINGYYDVAATLKMETLQDEITKGTHAAFMNAHNLWGRRRAMKFSGVDDIEEEEEDIAVDELMQTPLMKAQVVQRAMSESPEMQKMAAELEEQGVDITELLTGGSAEIDTSNLAQARQGTKGGGRNPGDPGGAGGSPGRGGQQRSARP